MTPLVRSDIAEPIGLVAGSGDFPFAFAAEVQRQGRSLILVAHIGEVDPSLVRFASEVLWVRLGEVEKAIRFFQHHSVSTVSFLGGIQRTRLCSVRLDWLAVRTLFRARSIRDDAVLKSLAKEYGLYGIDVVSPEHFLPEALAAYTIDALPQLSQQQRRDCVIGWQEAQAHGRADRGQMVVVADGKIWGRESIRGTDYTLRRLARKGLQNAIMVKLPKPQQDRRLDLPAVGPRTLELMHEAGVTTLVLENRGAYILDKQRFFKLAASLRIHLIVAATARDFL